MLTSCPADQKVAAVQGSSMEGSPQSVAVGGGTMKNISWGGLIYYVVVIFIYHFICGDGKYLL